MKKRTRAKTARWLAAALMILIGGCGARPIAGGGPPIRTPVPSVPLPPRPNQRLGLYEAVNHAFLRSPAIRAGEASLRAARGRLTSAGTYPYNPVLAGEAASRNGGGQSSIDYGVALGQEIEIAGQRGNRIDTAQREYAAERSQLLRAKRLIAAHVHFAFVTALEARELLDVGRQDMGLAERLHNLAGRRLARGAATQLDVNIAAAEFGRAGARFHAAQAHYLGARAVLAESMGLDPSFLPLPTGDLKTKLDPLPPLGEVVQAAREHRADLQALRQLEAASRARYSLARSEAWPNITLSAFAAREEDTDTIVGGGLSIPIPLFDRNQGRIEETRAGIDQASAEREAGELAASREVVTAHARYQAGIRTSERLQQLVFGTLEKSLELLQRAFDAGKASWPEVVVIRRTMVDAQRELTSATADARRAWIELQVASGKMPIPKSTSTAKEER